MITNLNSRILYEDNHLIVINKLPGELVQGDKSGDKTLIDDVTSFLRHKYDKKGNVYLGVVHRLDRPTSGIVIYAKTDKALSRMNELFREGSSIKRYYWAVVDKMPPSEEGTLVHYLTKENSKNKSYATLKERKKSREGRLNYKVIGASKSFFLLEVELLTGRHHQIRAQLAAIGVHIKGDLKYGFKRSNSDGSIHLHSRKVSFVHPIKKELLTIEAPPPTEPLWDFFYSFAGEKDSPYWKLERL